jgi:hypothetical protein
VAWENQGNYSHRIRDYQTDGERERIGLQFSLVNATGYFRENNAMACSPGTNEDRQMKDLNQLNPLIDQHDTVF